MSVQNRIGTDLGQRDTSGLLDVLIRAGLILALAMLCYQVSTGVGVWGNGHPVMWGWDIINFVWWIGIGHAGTLILSLIHI